MIRLIKKYNFLFLLSISIIGSILIALFFGIRFQGTDDVVMALISSGAYSGSLDSHLVYINFIYGLGLNLFYYVIPSIEWYTIFFVVINIVSVSVIAKGILKYIKHYILKIALLVFLASIFLQITADLQFTKTAGVTALAGVLLIVNESRKNQFFGIFLFVLGALIRFDAAFLVLLLSGPVFLFDFFKFKKKGLSFKNKIIFVAVGLSLFFKVVDYSFYNSDPEWKYYKEYNNHTNKIYGNLNAFLLLNKNINKLTPIDYEAFLYFFPNPAVINLDAVKTIKKEIDKTPFQDSFKNTSQIKTYYRSLGFLILIGLTLLVLIKGRVEKGIVLSFLFMIFAVLLYISLSASLKYRVFFICFTTFFFFLSFFLKNQQIKLAGSFIIAVVLFVFSGYLNERFYTLNKEKQIDIGNFSDVNLMTDKYLSDTSKKIVPFLIGYPISAQNAFSLSKKFQSDQIYLTGWLANVPFNKNNFDSFDYYAQGYGLLVSKDNTELAIKFVKSSVFLNSNLEISPKIVLESKEHVVVEFEVN